MQTNHIHKLLQENGIWTDTRDMYYWRIGKIIVSPASSQCTLWIINRGVYLKDISLDFQRAGFNVDAQDFKRIFGDSLYFVTISLKPESEDTA